MMFFSLILLVAPFAFASPVATSKPTATCSYIEKSPAPTGRYCGTQGRLLKANEAMAQFSGTNEAACLTHCLAAKDSSCKAFALDKNHNKCELYDTGIAKAGKFEAGMSNVWYWNHDCFEESCATNENHSTTTIPITKAPTPTAGPSATKPTSSISVPVTTIGPPQDRCVVPLPLSIHDCKVITSPVLGFMAKYSLYFNGTGVVENTNNPGNVNKYYPSFNTTISGSATGCEAATDCVSAATANGLGSIYMSFDLHYNLPTCNWMCVLYGGYNHNGTYFDVKDKNAFRTHGFTAQLHKA